MSTSKGKGRADEQERSQSRGDDSDAKTGDDSSDDSEDARMEVDRDERKDTEKRKVCFFRRLHCHVTNMAKRRRSTTNRKIKPRTFVFV